MRKRSASLETKDMQIRSTMSVGIGHSCTLPEGVQVDVTFLEGNLAIFIKSLKNVHTDL